MIDRKNYCKDCKRSIWGEFQNCDINIYNKGEYVGEGECFCKVKNEKKMGRKRDF